MNKLINALKKIRQKPIGLMTHVVIGYPSRADTIDLVKIMEQNGADIVELQIPFSDPLADGPTIMKACEKALENGTRVHDALSIIQQLSKDVSIPLICMCYFNTIFRFGIEKFIQVAKEAGCDGLIVPDMPLEEEAYEHFYGFCKKYDMPVIHVVSPVTTNEKLRLIAKSATGFVYATARQGITGAKDTLGTSTIDFLQRVKQHISLPIAVGFGISNKKQIQSLVGFASIVVIGSALITVVNTSQDAMKGVSEFLTSLMIE